MTLGERVKLKACVRAAGKEPGEAAAGKLATKAVENVSPRPEKPSTLQREETYDTWMSSEACQPHHLVSSVSPKAAACHLQDLFDELILAERRRRSDQTSRVWQAFTEQESLWQVKNVFTITIVDDGRDPSSIVKKVC